jgi:hypothetical protein
MNEKIEIKAWMPVTKGVDGNFVGILSDTSMDRDNEFMSKELIQGWAAKNKTLKALANHENKMQSWVGGWNNLQSLEKGKNSALLANPWFFSKEANPLADQIKKQVEEAIEKGLNPGISIGAIPTASENREIDGKMYKVFTEAELVEATWVPIQSNRNASSGHVAKGFDIDLTEKDIITEEIKMSDEIKVDVPEQVAKEAPEAVVEAEVVEPVVEEKAEEVVEEKKEEEVVEEVKAEEPVVEEEPKIDPQAEVEAAKAKVIALEKELEELKKQSINLPTVEGPVSKEAIMDNEPLTVEKMVKLRFGGN